MGGGARASRGSGYLPSQTLMAPSKWPLMMQLSQQTRSLQDEATSTTCTPGWAVRGSEVRGQPEVRGVSQRVGTDERSCTD